MTKQENMNIVKLKLRFMNVSLKKNFTFIYLKILIKKIYIIIYSKLN